MGWQRRGSHTFYYRSRWSEGRYHSEYIGRGPLAEYVANETESRRAEQVRVQQELRALDNSLGPLDALVRRLERVTLTLIEGELLSLGYRRCHRNWRGIRHARELARQK